MRKPSARGAITRELATEAALAIADRDGFDGVTMRAIAGELGATPMALYAYFADKDALYEAMREQVFARACDVASTARHTWQSMLDGLARAIYQIMREHPNWTPLLAHKSGFPSAGLAFLDKIFELMLRDGLEYEDVMRAYGCVMSFAMGSLLFERAMTDAGNIAPKRLALLKEHMGRAPERFASLAMVVANVGPWRWDDTFDLGLRWLLAGVEAQARIGGRAAARKRSRRAPR